jgi:hypothetical protein
MNEFFFILHPCLDNYPAQTVDQVQSSDDHHHPVLWEPLSSPQNSTAAAAAVAAVGSINDTNGGAESQPQPNLTEAVKSEIGPQNCLFQLVADEEEEPIALSCQFHLEIFLKQILEHELLRIPQPSPLSPTINNSVSENSAGTGYEEEVAGLAKADVDHWFRILLSLVTKACHHIRPSVFKQNDKLDIRNYLKVCDVFIPLPHSLTPIIGQNYSWWQRF